MAKEKKTLATELENGSAELAIGSHSGGADDARVDELLLACHARGMLPSSAFLKKCDQTARRVLLIRRLLPAAAFAGCPVGCNPFDWMADVSRAANIAVADVEDALELLPGTLIDPEQPVESGCGESSRQTVLAARLQNMPDLSPPLSESGRKPLGDCLAQILAKVSADRRAGVSAAIQKLSGVELPVS